MKIKKYLFSCGLLFSTNLFATCIQEGGNERCTVPKLSKWAISSYPTGLHGANVWCSIRGGWTDPNGTCHNAFLVTEYNLISLNHKFFETYAKPLNPYEIIDTNWTLPSNPATSQIYLKQNGVEISKHRAFNVYETGIWVNSNFFANNRKFTCPLNTLERKQRNGDLLCAEPLKKTTCNGVGNPCSITTGNKFLNEVDWRGEDNLQFTRTYNSLNYDNADNIISAPFRSKLISIGVNWTHNYNSRIHLSRYTENDETENILETRNFNNPQYIWGTITRQDGQEENIYAQKDGSSKLGVKFFIGGNSNLILEPQSQNIWKITQSDTGIQEYYDQTGKLLKITYPNGQFITLSYADVRLSSTTIQTDMLTQVTNNFGRSLKFNYNPQGLIASVTLPNNKKIIYLYDAQDRLSSVTRPGYGTKTYHYSENSTVAPSGNPNLLTGITDEAGKRYANYAYDSADRGILTEHAGGAQKYTLQHSDDSTNVTDPSGASWRYSKVLASGTPRISSSFRDNVQQSQNEYDLAGNITKKTDKGLTTKYTYDLSRNLETSRTEAVGTAQERITETTWHTDFAKPVEIKTSSNGQTLRVVSFTYDASGNILTKKTTAPNSTDIATETYTYNSNGQLTSYAPNAVSITTYTYDAVNGNLLTTKNPQGVITTYALYNASGKPTKITTNTGQSTELIYDDADRIIEQRELVKTTTLQRQQSDSGLSWWQQLINALYSAFGADAPYTEPEQRYATTATDLPAQQAITKYEYDQRGLLTSSTLPDGEKIEYLYDDAQRLIEVKDKKGNRSVYTLNGNGDITQIDVYGNNGQLDTRNQQVYDSFGRLKQTIGNSQQFENIQYDSSDRKSGISNGLNQNYTYSYDALNRQIKETNPLGDSYQTEYDALDQLKKVIDAKGNSTSYEYNAYGKMIKQISPDTGTTNYEYYGTGLLRSKNNEGKQVIYQYNPGGNVNLRRFSSNAADYEYYDYGTSSGSSPADKLRKASNRRAETSFSYDVSGLVRKKSTKYLTTQQAVAPVLDVYYSYTLGGKLKQLGLPSGNVVNYDYSANGQLSGIRLNDQSYIQNIQYSANGLSGWTFSGLGDSTLFSYDLDGRLKRISSNGIFDKNYQFDMGNRILSITDPVLPGFNSNFTHDALDRLTEQRLSDQTLKYAYDKNSNRLSRQTVKSTGTVAENYTIETNSNRLTNIQQGTANKAYQYLPSGQISSDGTRNYTYDTQGRSETISRTPNSILNGYDAFGQRVIKFTNGSAQVLFVYDESGQLLGEYSADGKVIREYIWLDGLLVGLRSYQYPNEILRVHTDHLGTPRAISNSANQVVWRWEGDQFGDVLPTGSLNFPLRHAGQYFDHEVGGFYNYFRDYDPITGRYVQSDPIGLDGGPNTYGYVSSNPLLRTDPKGLIEWSGTVFTIGAKYIKTTEIFTLATKCISQPGTNGRAGYARVVGREDFGIGYGISLSGGNITFEDNLSDVQPTVFKGGYIKYGYGAAWGIGFGGAYIKLGGAKSITPIGLIGGIDLSIGAVYGLSIVTQSRINDCCNM